MSQNSNINSERLLSRFLRYVKIDTTANPESNDYPSSPGQIELGRQLAEELRAMGASNVEQDSNASCGSFVEGVDDLGVLK